MFAQQRLGDLDVGPRRAARHTDELHAVQLQQPEQVEVTGILDEYRVARLQHQAHDEIERVARAVRDENLLRLRVDAEWREMPAQVLPQQRVALRLRIVDQARRVAAHDVPYGLGDAVDVAPRSRHEAARQLEAIVGRRELLEDVAGFFLGDLRIRAADRRAAVEPVGHVEARAVTRLDQAAGRERVVCLDDGEAADLLVGRHLADRRQFYAAAQMSRANHLFELASELLVERDAGRRIEREFHLTPSSGRAGKVFGEMREHFDGDCSVVFIPVSGF